MIDRCSDARAEALLAVIRRGDAPLAAALGPRCSTVDRRAETLLAALGLALGDALLADVPVTAFTGTSEAGGEAVGTATVAPAALLEAVASRLAASTVRARLQALPEDVLAQAVAALDP